MVRTRLTKLEKAALDELLLRVITEVGAIRKDKLVDSVAKMFEGGIGESMLELHERGEITFGLNADGDLTVKRKA